MEFSSIVALPCCPNCNRSTLMALWFAKMVTGKSTWESLIDSPAKESPKFSLKIIRSSFTTSWVISSLHRCWSDSNIWPLRYRWSFSLWLSPSYRRGILENIDRGRSQFGEPKSSLLSSFLCKSHSTSLHLPYDKVTRLHDKDLARCKPFGAVTAVVSRIWKISLWWRTDPLSYRRWIRYFPSKHSTAPQIPFIFIPLSE